MARGRIQVSPIEESDSSADSSEEESDMDDVKPEPRGPKWHGTGGADTYVFDRMLRPDSRSSDESDHEIIEGDGDFSGSFGQEFNGPSRSEAATTLPSSRLRDVRGIPQTKILNMYPGAQRSNELPPWGNSTTLNENERNSHFVFDESTRKAHAKRRDHILAKKREKEKISSEEGGKVKGRQKDRDFSEQGQLRSRDQRRLREAGISIGLLGRVDTSEDSTKAKSLTNTRGGVAAATSSSSTSLSPSSSGQQRALPLSVAAPPPARSQLLLTEHHRRSRSDRQEEGPNPAACSVRVCFMGVVRRLRLPAPLSFSDLEERVAFSFGLGPGMIRAARPPHGSSSSSSSSSESSSVHDPNYLHDPYDPSSSFSSYTSSSSHEGGHAAGGGGGDSEGASSRPSVSWGGAAYGTGLGFRAPCRTKLCTRAESAATVTIDEHEEHFGDADRHTTPGSFEGAAGTPTAAAAAAAAGAAAAAAAAGDEEDEGVSGEDMVDTRTFVDDGGFLDFGAGFALQGEKGVGGSRNGVGGRGSSSGFSEAGFSPPAALVGQQRTSSGSEGGAGSTLVSPLTTAASFDGSSVSHPFPSPPRTRSQELSRGFTASLTSGLSSTEGLPSSGGNTSTAGLDGKSEDFRECPFACSATPSLNVDEDLWGGQVGIGAAQVELRMDDGLVTMAIRDDASLKTAVDWARKKGGRTGGVLRITAQQRNRRPLRSAFKKAPPLRRAEAPGPAPVGVAPRPSTMERLENFRSDSEE